MSEYRMKAGNFSRTVVKVYKKVENVVVSGYKKIENKFSQTFLNEDGSMKTGGMAKKVTTIYKKV